mmetsp:Transcript_25805/g.79608  ORF Transcript_25805/g.79608 Transcript_25805/m.79608 type:complete len:453 (+) Transcript_25805:1565-2923(+)
MPGLSAFPCFPADSNRASCSPCPSVAGVVVAACDAATTAGVSFSAPAPASSTGSTSDGLSWVSDASGRTFVAVSGASSALPMPESTRSCVRGAARCRADEPWPPGVFVADGGEKIREPRAGRGADADGDVSPDAGTGCRTCSGGVCCTIGEYGSRFDPNSTERDAWPGRLCRSASPVRHVRKGVMPASESVGDGSDTAVAVSAPACRRYDASRGWLLLCPAESPWWKLWCGVASEIFARGSLNVKLSSRGTDEPAAAPACRNGPSMATAASVAAGAVGSACAVDDPADGAPPPSLSRSGDSMRGMARPGELLLPAVVSVRPPMLTARGPCASGRGRGEALPSVTDSTIMGAADACASLSELTEARMARVGDVAVVPLIPRSPSSVGATRTLAARDGSFDNGDSVTGVSVPSAGSGLGDGAAGFCIAGAPPPLAVSSPVPAAMAWQSANNSNN